MGGWMEAAGLGLRFDSQERAHRFLWMSGICSSAHGCSLNGPSAHLMAREGRKKAGRNFQSR
eukprot:344580-Amphidinium_carterae.1